MKMRQHYIALRSALPQLQEQEPYEVTTQELAAALDCTHRNMVLLLQRMQREGWLSWEPRRGRGNRSVLKFLARKEEIVLQEAQEIAQKQDLQVAISYLQAMDSEGSWGLRAQFQEWLSKRFGFHSEVLGERRLDILRFPLPQTIHSLDPASIHYSGEAHLVNQLFDGLVRINPSGETILPHLAHTWDIDKTRTLWTFYLRKGVLFHHGREMVAADVVFTFERLKALAPRGLYNWVYRGIVSIEMLDERTVRFVLEQRNEAFLPFLATNRASIVPAPEASPSSKAVHNGSDRFSYTEFGLQPIGTGPFRLVDREHGVMVLEAFPAYFQGRGFLDRVEVWTQPLQQQLDGQAEQPAFQVMHNVRLSETATEQWQQVRQSGTTCKFLTVNELREGPLTDAVMRETFDMLLNRAEIIERLSGDVIEPADSFWPQSSTSGYPYAAAPDDAQQRLAEAGYKGEPIILATIPQYEADAIIVQQVCALAGITLVIKFIPAEQFKGEERLHADLLLFAIMLDEHRELRLIDLFKSMQLHMRPDTQAILEQLLTDLLSESDAKRRADRFRQIEQLLTAAHSLMFLYRKHLKTAFHPSIRGISLESLGWVHFRDLWFTNLPE
ncbi:ABC transporter substrate-binding protein [Paenibacillus sp. BC26]|uniref:ABC transporter substrate-binding protein n=1 Tax=Paenibacillus sp. BC26 TaxID=1881032 RepID=UPI0008EF0033|nr:ABC transporter substrate-binding protein [Paenibacillus sp. BC26]SFS67862.1 DNA-binding transcriptional regulator SgrR of sgrS sRNA, contains a MarR-type HTH domain and a solute-binding domain [Paenibacillus sp. BC26]